MEALLKESPLRQLYHKDMYPNDTSALRLSLLQPDLRLSVSEMSLYVATLLGCSRPRDQHPKYRPETRR